VITNYINRIPFGDGKWLFEQDPVFADAAKKQVMRIKKKWRPPEHFYHLAKGGHVSAISHQLDYSWFCKVDLKRFFQQITRNRVTRHLRSIGYPKLDAIDFAKDSTVLYGDIGPRHFALPYGFTQSPILASLVLDGTPLGKEMYDLVAQDFEVGVYVDDILIAHKDKGQIELAWERAIEAATRSNLVVNEKKSSPPATSCEAFNINYEAGLMQITADRMAEFSEEVLMCGKGATATAILEYVRSVNEDQARELKASFPGIYGP